MRKILKRVITKVQHTVDPAQRRHSLVGPAALWKVKRDFQIGFLKEVGLQPQHHLLDIGCGTLRGGLPLIEYLEKGHYYGIEARPEVLEEGRSELKSANLEGKEPTLIATADLLSVNLPVKFDYIWAFAVLIHMSDEILDSCCRLVSNQLAEGGYFYANVNISDRADKSWQGFPVVYRSEEFYKGVAERHGLEFIDLGSLKDLGHNMGVEGDYQRMLRFQTRLPKRAEAKKL